MSTSKKQSLKSKNNNSTRGFDILHFLTKLGFRLMWVVAIVVALLLAILYQTLFGRVEHSKQLVEIGEGESYYALVSDWEEDVPFFSSTMAKGYIKWMIKDPLYLGTYEIPKNPNFLEVMQVLQKGSKSALVKVQIIEGKRASDLYDKLKNTKGIEITVLDKPYNELKHTLGFNPPMPKATLQSDYANNLEGLFAPDTYMYAEGTTDKQILLDLYERQKHNLDIAWENRASNLPYNNKYEALIMASIIEKETGLAEERAEVAGVFVNRLNQGMRLQTDPTIIYGMGDRYDGDIRKADIQEKTDYNTYQIDGLPPTPISLPSMAAIDAALHPADTDALFFVATGKGGHKFSRTYEEHQKAVQEYLSVIRE